MSVPGFLKSRTGATLLSQAARLGGMAALLPLIVHKLPAPEVALWYLFATIMTLQMLADLGFATVLARVYAFASVGSPQYRDLRVQVDDRRATGRTDVEQVWRIARTADWIYPRVVGAWLLLAGVFGSLAARPLVQETQHPMLAWLAWAVMLLTSATQLGTQRYTSLFMGLDRVPPLRLTEAAVRATIGMAALVAVWMGGGLLAVAICHLTGAAGTLLALDRLADRGVLGGDRRFLTLWPEPRPNASLLATVWPSAWRSGVGIALMVGVSQGSGLIVARLVTAREAAAYLIALNLMRAIYTISEAPFYSSIPLLAQLRARRDFAELRRRSELGMRRSYWAFCVLVIVAGTLMPWLLRWVDGDVRWVSDGLWVAMAAALLFERHGALHLQLYSTTNHIIWHWVNGVAGVLMLTGMAVLVPRLGLIGLPLGHLVGTAGFYFWVSARHAYRDARLPFPGFEVRTSLLPVAVLAAWVLLRLPR